MCNNDRNINQIFEEDIQHCVRVFSHHGVVIYPTDTIWGLGCDARDHKAVQKIFSIKKRPAHKSLIVLVSDIRMLREYIANLTPEMEEIIDAHHTPTTFILPQGIKMAESLLAEDHSIAVRICKDPFCKALIKRIKAPLVSTSVNYSGEPAPVIFPEIKPQLLTQADYVVQWRQEDTTRVKPSAIYRILENGNTEKLR